MENISLIPVFLAIPVSALVYVQFSSTTTTTTSQPHFHLSLVVYAVAAVLKLPSEPLYIRAQNELRPRALLSYISKSVVASLVVAFFAAGQAAYGLSLLVVFLGVYKGDINYVPKRVRTRLHGKCVLPLYNISSPFNLTSPKTQTQTVPRHRISTPSY